MMNVLLAEMKKLKGSLILLVALAVPAMLGILSFMMIVTGNAPEDWQRFAMSSAAIWAYFLFPMTVTAVAALLGFIEHRSGYWAHLLALPIPRWQIFFAKLVGMLSIIGFVSVVLGLTVFAIGYVAGIAAPAERLSGDIPVLMLAGLLGKMFLAGFLMMAIQLWVSLRIANFVAPIVVGIGGTFVAVAATSAKSGVYFPWLMPVSMLASDPARAQMALVFGVGGGLLLFALMIADLSRRDWK